jgi:hypothetical protein
MAVTLDAQTAGTTKAANAAEADGLATGRGGWHRPWVAS